MDKKNYTLELNEVISYVNDVLVNEFPKNQITSEYLIMSILDHKNCHANMILDNCMTSNNLEELKKVYSLTKTNPEKIESIRAWGRERATNASKN